MNPYKNFQNCWSKPTITVPNVLQISTQNCLSWAYSQTPTMSLVKRLGVDFVFNPSPQQLQPKRGTGLYLQSVLVNNYILYLYKYCHNSPSGKCVYLYERFSFLYTLG